MRDVSRGVMSGVRGTALVLSLAVLPRCASKPESSGTHLVLESFPSTSEETGVDEWDLGNARADGKTYTIGRGYTFSSGERIAVLEVVSRPDEPRGSVVRALGPSETSALDADRGRAIARDFRAMSTALREKTITQASPAAQQKSVRILADPSTCKRSTDGGGLLGSSCPTQLLGCAAELLGAATQADDLAGALDSAHVTIERGDGAVASASWSATLLEGDKPHDRACVQRTPLADAYDEFTKQLHEIDRLNKDCSSQRQCSGDVGTASLRPLDATLPRGEPLLNYRFCDALRPLAALESPIFFVGANAGASGIDIEELDGGGVDLAFDLKNQQAALFHYHTDGVQNLIGLGASVYAGWAFGDKPNIIDAWSGEFQAGSASIDVPLLKLSAGGSIFRSPDNSLWGAAASLGIGFNLLPATLEVGVSEGDWTAWDAATNAYAKTLFRVGYDIRSASFKGHDHDLIQFRSSKDIALALVETTGSIGVAPAAQAVALSILRARGLTIKDACGL